MKNLFPTSNVSSLLPYFVLIATSFCMYGCSDSSIEKNKNEVMRDLHKIEQEISLYYMNNRSYPEGLAILDLERGFKLKDPWGQDYLYDRGDTGAPLRIYSLGRDGVKGGEGDDTDYELPF